MLEGARKDVVPLLGIRYCCVIAGVVRSLYDISKAALKNVIYEGVEYFPQIIGPTLSHYSLSNVMTITFGILCIVVYRNICLKLKASVETQRLPKGLT